MSGGSHIKLSVMVSLFQWIQKSKTSTQKRSKFRKFLDAYCRRPDDYFAAMRLILPGLDRERGSYGFKEHVLATCLIDALAISRDSEDARRLLNWRKGGPKSGTFAGNFSLVAAEVLQRRQGLSSGELTVKELNDLLDQLASSENRAEKTSVLSDLIRKTNAQEMKWIIMIILKDLKLGTSEKSIFHEFHPDAEDLFNVTCDLKLVCEKLWDRSQRHKRQDIEVGKPVRPQLALRVSNASAAWKKLHGKDVVVECKFDGDRIQIHKNKAEIHFYSRNFIDHPEYEHAMTDLIMKNILVDKCILDGEMLVWDVGANRFAEFGSNQEIAKAAKEGLESDRQLCYVAFDILYVGDTSVIHQSLKERHDLLRKFVKPIKGRLEILVPNGGLNSHRPTGEPCWSFVAHTVDEVEKFFKGTVENRDEGIVLKDLGSKWEPSDRSGKWLKLKPEYIRAGSDLDVLIIGGYYGSGRRGGEVAQFLVGLAERPLADAYPKRFVSFCRVGTGLSDEELNKVVNKLKPFFRKYEYPKQAPPSFYQVTNNSKERPDVWVVSPEKSIIVSITSDIRTIRSEAFAAPYSLRFPRIDRVRFDKPWHECLDVRSFVELVHSSNGTTQGGKDYQAGQDHKPGDRKTSRKREKKSVAVVPSHFIQTDVSHIKGETSIFSDMVFFFVNVPSSQPLDSWHKMVIENGGSFSMNLNNSVTHCIAAESKGIKFQAAKLRGDVIHYSWFLECCSQKKLIPLQPKHFLFLSESSKRKLKEELDEFSDSYYVEINIDELKQLLSSVGQSGESDAVERYRMKYCPKDKWARFHGCYIFFYLPMQILKKLEWKALLELASRRMKVEVTMGGGKVVDNLSCATHFVVMSFPGFDIDFMMLLTCFSAAEKRLICRESLNVVSSKWLEDCLEKEQRLPDEGYSLKTSDLDVSVIAESRHDLDDKDNSRNNIEIQNLPSASDKVEQSRGETTLSKPRVITLPKAERRRKRGRPSNANKTKGSLHTKQTRRTRARVGSKPIKIQENESDKGSSDEHEVGEESESSRAKHGNYETASNQSLNNTIDDMVLDMPEPSETGEAAIQEDADFGRKDPALGEVPEIPSSSGNSSRDNEKLGQEVDPFEAMLLNMIPSLGTQKPESTEPVRQDKPHIDSNTSPQKKKKVSYKDVANELLKDR